MRERKHPLLEASHHTLDFGRRTVAVFNQDLEQLVFFGLTQIATLNHFVLTRGLIPQRDKHCKACALIRCLVLSLKLLNGAFKGKTILRSNAHAGHVFAHELQTRLTIGITEFVGYRLGLRFLNRTQSSA